MRTTAFSLRGNALAQAEISRMSDSAMVYTILLIGGALYTIVILFTTVTSVRESDANNPPPGEH